MDNIIIKTPDEELYEAVQDLLHKDFRKRERMNVSSGSPADAENATSPYRDWLEEGFSLVAIDSQKDIVVGAAVNYTVSRSDQHEITSSMPIRKRFFLTIMEELKQGFDIFEELDTDKGMELCLLSVKEDYSGMGIGRRLTEETIQLARNREMKFIQSVPTAAATRHIFQALGFETRREKKFQEFSFEGLPAFPLANPDDIARYVVKKL